MRNRFFLSVATVSAVLMLAGMRPGNARADDAVVAIVASIDQPYPENVGPMGLLHEGTRVSLRDGQRIVIAYFSSCIEETVTGGTVLVGAQRSEVTGGTVTSRKLDCDEPLKQLELKDQATAS